MNLSERPDSDRQATRAVWLSFAWTALALPLAIVMPWLSLAPPALLWILNVTPLAVTAGFILWSFGLAIRQVGRVGHTLVALPLTVAQFVLFTLLFVQIACHLGMGHYQMSATPRWWDWLAFSAAHALRAADLLDVIEGYRLDIQVIRHGSGLTACVVVALHLVMGLFVISLVMEWLGRAWRWLRSSGDLWRATRIVLVTVVLLTLLSLGWMVFLLKESEYRAVTPADLALWPVEQLLRVVDFADVMVVYGLHLRPFPVTILSATVGVVLRLVLALLAAGLLRQAFRSLSLRALRGFGLSREELTNVSKAGPDSRLGRLARQRLDDLVRTPEPSTRKHWAIVSVGCLGLAALVIALRSVPAGWGWDAAAERTAAAAVGDDPDLASRGLAGLQRMGVAASVAVPTLEAALSSATPERRTEFLETLGYLGPEAAPILEGYARSTDLGSAGEAVQALGRMGPDGVPSLVWLLDDGPEELRGTARDAILALGPKAVDPLTQVVSHATAAEVVPLLDELDPYWYLRDPPDDDFKAVAEAKVAFLMLAEPERHAALREEFMADDYFLTEDLLDLGRGSERAVPEMLQRFRRADISTEANMIMALGRLGPRGREALPELIARLRVNSSNVELIRTLDAIDPNWPTSAVAQEALRAAVAEWHTGDDERIREIPGFVRLFGPAAVPVQDDLRRLAEAGDSGATSALTLTEPYSLTELLTRLDELGEGRFGALAGLESEGGLTESEIFFLLARMGPEAAPAVTTLVEAVRREETWFAYSPLDVLARIGSAAAPGLISLFADGRYYIRDGARDALVRIGTDAVPALLDARRSAEPNVRTMAEITLERIDPRWRMRYRVVD